MKRKGQGDKRGKYIERRNVRRTEWGGYVAKYICSSQGIFVNMLTFPRSGLYGIIMLDTFLDQDVNHLSVRLESRHFYCQET